jgi:hypothetical protein
MPVAQWLCRCECGRLVKMMSDRLFCGVVGCCGWNVKLWSFSARCDWKNRRGLLWHLWCEQL